MTDLSKSSRLANGTSRASQDENSGNQLPCGLPRFVQVGLAVFGLVLAAPVIVVAALGVRLSSRGPVIFRHERVGLHGRTFLLLKLRTMRTGNYRRQITSRGDPRVTLVGRVLRKFKIDELPQLWNVLRGDMALIGPRPEVPHYVDFADPLWRRILLARPGLTDVVTLTLRNEEELLEKAGDRPETFYREKLLPFKMKLNAEYLDRRSAWNDLKVLCHTAAAVFKPKCAVSMSVSDVVDGKDPTKDRTHFWTRYLHRELQYVLDLAMLSSVFIFTYLLRFEFSISRRRWKLLLVQLLIVILIQFVTAYLCGIYRYVWRYIGMSEILTFVRVAIYSAAPLLLLRFGLSGDFAGWRVPLSIILMDTIFASGGLLGLRVLRRALYERFERSRQRTASTNTKLRPVLLVGAGRSGRAAMREIQAHGDIGIEPVGFVDDFTRRHGSMIHGMEVLGTTSDLPELIAKHAIEQVIVTGDTNTLTLRRIHQTCQRMSVKVRILPRMEAIIQGKVSVSGIRDVQLDDLLGREPVKLDEDVMRRFLVGRSVMVTGAGGSIGSELCRQIVQFKVATLILVERAEGALFTIERELGDLWPDLSITSLVADVGDEGRMRWIFDNHRPQIILHAAAHKHVPMMERNPGEAVKNNVVATRMLGRLAGEAGAECFVFISTDKAVRPSSVMGATKRIGELIMQDLDQQFPQSRFVAVRFGNVLGSAGSVIPIFREQIKRGGPVTVTHAEVTRYFMTIPEAAKLVLEASALGRGDEIMILDMGNPVKILDLAKDMITLAGYKPFEDIPILFTGLRPGEKMFEQLELEGEDIQKTRHPKIFVGRVNRTSRTKLNEVVQRLDDLVRDGRDQEIRRTIAQYLPEASLSQTHSSVDFGSAPGGAM